MLTMLATFLAQYGGGGSSSGGGGSSGGSYGGGGISYGPWFWVIAAVVVIAVIAVATWLYRRYRGRSSATTGRADPDRLDRAA